MVGMDGCINMNLWPGECGVILIRQGICMYYGCGEVMAIFSERGTEFGTGSAKGRGAMWMQRR